MPVIDLNVWHHAIHQVTGDMALSFNKAAPTDLKRWASVLHSIAEEMELHLQQKRHRSGDAPAHDQESDHVDVQDMSRGRCSAAANAE
jgi:hypothetical protein